MTLTADQADRLERGVARFVAEASVEQDLLAGVAARVRPVVPYDAAAWLTMDPATHLFTDGVIEAFANEICAPWFHNELLVDDVCKFRDLAGSRSRVGILHDEVDDPADSPRWRELMRPAGFDAELRLTLDDATGCWGGVELHRVAGHDGFSPIEADLLGRIAPVVAAGLRRLSVERQARTVTGTDGPGLLHVAADGTVTAMTEAGAAWLELLLPDRGTPTSLWTLGALARGGTHRPRQTRLRVRDGRWVRLHAAPLTGALADSGGSAVIVEPAHPAEIAGIIARAYGLSPRERDVAMAVARGEATADIARQLHISQHTVRDHLKAAFGKVGVASRTELVAALFHDHYADAFTHTRPESEDL